MNEPQPCSQQMACDVLVVGGGPAGSTIAALLAREGFRVVVIEKDHHPRFHIGESLLPMNLPLLEELGVKDTVENIAMPKFGVEFNSPHHNKTVEFLFEKALDKNHPSAYQVRRSQFDHILLKNAAAKGATVLEGHRASAVEFLPGGGARVTVSEEHAAPVVWEAKFLVDASGRDTLLATKLAIKRANPRHNTAAIYGHFEGAKRLCGKAEGHISIFWFEHGWIWFIPLADGTTSIGAVCRPDYFRQMRGKDVTAFFMETLAQSPALSERLTDATLTGPASSTGNYSYMAEHMAGRDYILLGDAFAFIDPIFSSGVYFAMSSAFEGAKVVCAALTAPAHYDAAVAQFDATVRRGLKTFSWYIYRMTRPAMRDMFMAPRNYLRMEEAMMSLLSGDVFRPSQVRARLLAFKAVFHVLSFAKWLRGLNRAPAAPETA